MEVEVTNVSQTETQMWDHSQKKKNLIRRISYTKPPHVHTHTAPHHTIDQIFKTNRNISSLIISS